MCIGKWNGEDRISLLCFYTTLEMCIIETARTVSVTSNIDGLIRPEKDLFKTKLDFKLTNLPYN